MKIIEILHLLMLLLLITFQIHGAKSGMKNQIDYSENDSFLSLKSLQRPSCCRRSCPQRNCPECGCNSRPCC